MEFNVILFVRVSLYPLVNVFNFILFQMTTITKRLNFANTIFQRSKTIYILQVIDEIYR